MRYLLILLVFFSCKPRNAPTVKETVRIDTVYRTDTVRLQPIKAPKTDTVVITIYRDNKEAIDSLKTKLFVANYKLERVRYYLKICLRNPSQDKFLKGWIKRAVE